jgi:hypothetical protein
MKTIYTFDHISLNSFRMKNISDKTGRENQNTHFVFNNFFPENFVFYEIMWKITVQWGRPQITKWRMRIACWITKDRNTHSEYVIIIAVPLQQFLHERVSVLRCTIKT